MPRKRFSPEQIFTKVCQIEVVLSENHIRA
jgi:hypothetical protein